MNDWAAEKEFLQTFRAEAEERLQSLAQGLMALEGRPGDEELLKKLFREAHTLKGSAGMMGFESVRDLAHRSEDILSSVQKGQLQLEKPVTDLLLETLDRIEELLPDPDSGLLPDIDTTDLSARLADVAGSATPVEDRIYERPRLLKKAESAGVVSGPEKSSEAAEEVDASSTAIEEAINATMDQGVSKGRPSRSEDPTIRVNIDRLDKLLNITGEMIVSQMDSEMHLAELTVLRDEAKNLYELFGSLASEAEKLKDDAEPDRLAAFSQKIAEAEKRSETVADGIDLAESRIKENTSVRRLALDELQDRTLQVRMLPVGNIYGVFHRVVRDAANACGKSVTLETYGEETELDKRVLEQMVDPLMHIIRNCVDHGIETPEVRKTAGKDETGIIRLSTSQRGDRIDIDIEDDGAGIDPKKVREQALRAGLIDAGEDLSADEIAELIFRPGFSTSTTITGISGRGVGLDVVKNNIEEMEGEVTVESQPGEGACFSVSLPVTLAVIKGLLVESGMERFIIPMSSVREMLAVREGQIQSLGRHKGILMRDTAIPAIDLLAYLGGGATKPADGKSYFVIVRSGKTKSIGLEVGRLLGEREIVIKPLDPFLGRIASVAGVSILGDGDVVAILNTNNIARDLKHGGKVRSEPESMDQSRVKTEPKRKKVLVVEDSLVVRELQRNILEAAGYDVDTAVDGEDALGMLAQSQCDCVVTDIEMPRMNGFDLTSALREREEFRDMPVIMVTSCSSDTDKQRGLDAGADAYVIKGSFDQHNLLETIERLVA